MIETLKKNKTVIFFGLCLVFMIGVGINTKNSISKSPKMSNGDLDSTFIARQDSIKYEKLIEETRKKMLNEGWEEKQIKTGLLPDCYNFKPIKSSINNYLDISVGRGTDVVIKLMNENTNECIRYVYINQGTSYKIKNIPEGVYRLRVAYGKNWMSKVENRKCIGKFLRDQYYKIGSQTFDFRSKRIDNNSISYPCWSLELDAASVDSLHRYNTRNISEDEFNK